MQHYNTDCRKSTLIGFAAGKYPDPLMSLQQVFQYVQLTRFTTKKIEDSYRQFVDPRS